MTYTEALKAAFTAEGLGLIASLLIWFSIMVGTFYFKSDKKGKKTVIKLAVLGIFLMLIFLFLSPFMAQLFQSLKK